MLARILLREHERERQAWERERLRLVETICMLAGRPLPEPTPAAEFAETVVDPALLEYDL